MTMESKGNYRVGLDFNPSGDPSVTRIKGLAAELIDAIDAIPLPPTPDTFEGNTANLNAELIHHGEVARLKALAQTAIEEGAMWAVKAATKPEPKEL